MKSLLKAMTSLDIVQNDVLLFMALMLAPFGVELVKTNLIGGLAVCGVAALFIFIRSFFKIDTAKKSGQIQ